MINTPRRAGSPHHWPPLPFTADRHYLSSYSSITYPLPSGATWATTSTVNYTYDNADLLSKVTDFNNNAITITPNADGLPKSAVLVSTGDTVATTYDNTDTPSAIAVKNSTTTLQSFTYSDSPAGTILSETDTPSSPQSPATYTYDAKGRVTSMTPGSGSPLNYTFDASSNLTTLPNGANATSGYDKAGELTSSTLSGTTTDFAYDANGQRLTVKQGSTMIAAGTWNGAGQLTAYSDPSASMSAADYDATGLRASATTGSEVQISSGIQLTNSPSCSWTPATPTSTPANSPQASKSAYRPDPLPSSSPTASAPSAASSTPAGASRVHAATMLGATPKTAAGSPRQHPSATRAGTPIPADSSTFLPATTIQPQANSSRPIQRSTKHTSLTVTPMKIQSLTEIQADAAGGSSAGEPAAIIITVTIGTGGGLSLMLRTTGQRTLRLCSVRSLE